VVSLLRPKTGTSFVLAMAASVFGTDLASDAAQFEGVIQVTGYTHDGMSMGAHVPSGFPVLVMNPALRLGRVTV
jgi:hypothetical protein